MVRRWSCINDFNLNFENKKIRFFKKSSKKRVFKLTISTRKFYKKYTKFRRKAFNRLRHKTNWVIYSNVFKSWSHDYLKSKSLSKTYWFFNNYKFNFLTFNWNSIKNVNTDLFCNYTYNLSNVGVFFSRFNLKFKIKKNYFSFLKNFKNISISSLEDTEESNDSLFISTNQPVAVYDNFFYDFENISKLDIFFFHFYDINFQLVIKYLINIRQFFFFLTFLNA